MLESLCSFRQLTPFQDSHGMVQLTVGAERVVGIPSFRFRGRSPAVGAWLMVRVP